MRIRDVNQPLNLFYKAKVFQNTDADSVNVKLILSTGNPNMKGIYDMAANMFILTFSHFLRHIYHILLEKIKFAKYNKSG